MGVQLFKYADLLVNLKGFFITRIPTLTDKWNSPYSQIDDVLCICYPILLVTLPVMFFNFLESCRIKNTFLEEEGEGIMEYNSHINVFKYGMAFQCIQGDLYYKNKKYSKQKINIKWSQLVTKLGLLWYKRI